PSAPSSFFLVACAACVRALHASPTRRSSDLLVVWTLFVAALYLSIVVGSFAQLWGVNYTFTTRHYQDFMTAGWPVFLYTARIARSEEHTSELQSRENLVCRLLLEKKKDHRRR